MALDSENGHLVLQAFDKYYESLTAVNRRRQMWRETIESELFNTLTSVKKGMAQLDAQVKTNKEIANYGSVIFSMNKTPSGIFQQNERSVSNHTKIGGELAFSQSYSGKIDVIIYFPYVEGFTNKTPPKVIETISPELITENLTMEMVAQFFNYMAKWEEQ